MIEVIFASSNTGKLVEIREVAKRFDISILSALDLCATTNTALNKIEVEENGVSYLENATLKAHAYYQAFGLASLGDDSGLEVEALDGAPGLLSARFAGENSNMVANRAKLLKLMQGRSDRAALFRCVLFLRVNAECAISAQATLLGRVATEERGQGGFGYDSIIEINGYGRYTLAELKDRKIAVSTHRIKALEQIFMQAQQLPAQFWPANKKDL